MRHKVINIFSLAGFSIALLLSACTKESSTVVTTQTDFNNNSLVRVYIATVNAARNYVYVDSRPLNGSGLASGGIFPASGIYASSIPAGMTNFLVRDTSSTSTQLPLNFAESMQSGKNYTIFVYDTITSPKQKTVQTSFVVPSDTTCRIRFANFIYNPSDVPAIDVYSFNRGANIFTNVPVTGVTDFIAYPSRVATDTLYIRETGTSVNILKLSLTGGLADKRSYTVVYRGSHRGTRVVSLFTDR